MAGKLIALTARSEAGKDYLADYLVKHHGWVRESFSDSLKEIAHYLFPWCDRDYPPEEKNECIDHIDNVNDMSPRDVWKGIDHLRNIDPTIFCTPTVSRVVQLLDQGFDVIVTDVRKRVEFDAMAEMGADVIRIRCAKETDYRDEDIIDTFKCDSEFFNDKRSIQDWVKFCVKEDFIQEAWVNILQQIVEEQIRITEMFSPRWRDEQPIPDVAGWRMAAAAEYAEFLEEASVKWKWWKPSAPLNRTKVIEEFADYVMFSISRVLVNAPTLDQGVDLFLSIGTEMDYGDIGVKVEKNFSLLHDYCNLVTSGSPISPQTLTTALIYSIDVFCHEFGVTLSEFRDVYMAKHKLNEQRQVSGYQQTGNKEGLEQINEPAASFSEEIKVTDLFMGGPSGKMPWDPIII